MLGRVLMPYIDPVNVTPVNIVADWKNFSIDGDDPTFTSDLVSGPYNYFDVDGNLFIVSGAGGGANHENSCIIGKKYKIIVTFTLPTYGASVGATSGEISIGSASADGTNTITISETTAAPGSTLDINISANYGSEIMSGFELYKL